MEEDVNKLSSYSAGRLEKQILLRMQLEESIKLSVHFQCRHRCLIDK